MRLLPAAMTAMALLIAVLLLSNRSLQHDLNSVRQQQDALHNQLQQRQRLIAELNQQMRLREEAERALREDLNSARQVMQSREQQRERSLHHDPQTRLWADSQLPADISRLHERPAFGSASDYLRWLSGSQLLPGTGQSSGH